MDSKLIDRCAQRQKTAVLKVERAKATWIRPIVFGLLSLLLIPLSSCKQNNWADWKLQNELWLESNKTKDSVQVSNTGLQYKIIADPLAGTGEAMPNTTATIICDYSVKLINGCIIETSKGAKLSLRNVIPGFAEGCHKIHSQGDIELYIPAYLGYDNSKYISNDYYSAEGNGTEGTQTYIPPYSALIYSVHICAIVSN